MLYAFFGTDVIGVREQAHAKCAEQEGEAVRVTPENWSAEMLADATGGVSLFGESSTYFIDTPSEHPEFFAYVWDHLDVFAESANVFVLVESGLRAPEKKKLTKHAAACVEVTASKTRPFNVFALADALARRDKKALWLLLAEAYAHGLADEEIIGTLFWQLKTIRLAGVSGSAAAAGMKPFVYTKAKRAHTKFSESELTQLSRELVAVYHDGHTGRRDIDHALERWVLEL